MTTCRRPEQAQELQALADDYRRVSVHRLDVTGADGIRAVADETAGQPVDVLLSNAGVFFGKFDADRLAALNYDGVELPW